MAERRLRLGLVGCGGMGTRHIYGLRELARTPFDNVELCALCDIRRDHAELAATEAEQLLGRRPRVYEDLERMAQEVELDAVDVVTDPSVHHQVVCQALTAGWHVMVEKPMAITVSACRLMLEAAQRHGRILSVAENFRRDPSARLVRHLLATGAIGTPYMALFHSLGPGNDIFISPWRHRRERGGFLLDMAVHFTHMIRYQLGDIDEVYGDVRMVEPVRRRPASLSSEYAFYRQRHAAMEPEIEAQAEDTMTAIFRLRSGATVNWLVGLGGHGRCARELILGDGGCIEGFGTRGGHIQLQRHGQAALDQAQILESEPGFELDPLTAHLFPTGVSAGDDAVDWKLIAIELHELAVAVLDGGPVEVDADGGLRDVAALYAPFESARAGRALRLSEVESGQAGLYQAEIDAALGIDAVEMRA